jgi:hypothetical protein
MLASWREMAGETIGEVGTLDAKLAVRINQRVAGTIVSFSCVAAFADFC